MRSLNSDIYHEMLDLIPRTLLSFEQILYASIQNFVCFNTKNRHTVRQYRCQKVISRNDLQYRSPVTISSTDLQYRSPVQISRTNLQYRSPVQISSTYLQYISSIQISRTDLQYRFPVQISRTSETDNILFYTPYL